MNQFIFFVDRGQFSPVSRLDRAAFINRLKSEFEQIEAKFRQTISDLGFSDRVIVKSALSTVGAFVVSIDDPDALGVALAIAAASGTEPMEDMPVDLFGQQDRAVIGFQSGRE